jgi:hypothetical protein
MGEGEDRERAHLLVWYSVANNNAEAFHFTCQRRRPAGYLLRRNVNGSPGKFCKPI